jgi:hypothetical protein
MKIRLVALLHFTCAFAACEEAPGKNTAKPLEKTKITATPAADAKQIPTAREIADVEAAIPDSVKALADNQPKEAIEAYPRALTAFSNDMTALLGLKTSCKKANLPGEAAETDRKIQALRAQ